MSITALTVRQVSNKTVLFDLQPLLTGTVDKKFNILKFRLTEEELLALIGSGTQGENNRTHCALSLQDIMGYMAEKNNLDDSRVAGLTLQDIEEFISEGLLQQPSSKKTMMMFFGAQMIPMTTIRIRKRLMSNCLLKSQLLRPLKPSLPKILL